jgi:hypothetical protein
MRKLVVIVVALIIGCGDTHFAPKVITANGGKQVAIACSGVIRVSGNQQDGYEVTFTDDKDQSHDWRGLHDVQIDDDSQLTKLCSTGTSRDGQAQTPTQSAPTQSVSTLPAPRTPVDECEIRFWNKLIHEVDGKSVVAACKENPERRP